MSELDQIFAGLAREKKQGTSHIVQLDVGTKATEQQGVTRTKHKNSKKSSKEAQSSVALPTDNDAVTQVNNAAKDKKRKRIKDTSSRSSDSGSKSNDSTSKVAKTQPRTRDHAVVVVDPTPKIREFSKPAPVKLDEGDAAFANSRGKDRTKTEEGYRIFTEDELKLNQGGGTPLCPFDCDCCF
ncbi:hypothetical protein MYAM1_000937 [Malassezia yamatoensis]|uniref:DUF1764-domain-containing protein n=1 Tax=Malassezia yamatoensis TaxID=253288 RepID=A0AAJ5YV57_9BASI|nr:hypothetical protein MYAM1_000937 [Malassezia yamatoensis]